MLPFELQTSNGHDTYKTKCKLYYAYYFTLNMQMQKLHISFDR